MTYRQKFNGLAVEGQANNVVLFWPKKHFTKIGAWVADREDWIAKLKNDGIEEPVPMPRHDEEIQFRFISAAEVQQHRAVLKELFEAARVN